MDLVEELSGDKEKEATHGRNFGPSLKRTNRQVSTLVIVQSFPLLGPGLGDVHAFQGGHAHKDGTDGFVHFGLHGILNILTPGQFEGRAYMSQYLKNYQDSQPFIHGTC